MDWPNVIRLILYLMGLAWTFLGVAVISDVFMAGIEKVTSSKKRVKDKTTGRTITVYVWNATVANLTLMALGSSAPEILLSLIEITSDEFFLGPLGAGTIVGSAAFNLLIICGVCICAIPDNEVRMVKQTTVYIVTASCSVFAYLWLMFILKFSSKDVCELWEALLTLMFCPILVLVAYIADRGYLDRKKPAEYTEQDDHHDHCNETIPDDATDEELAEVAAEIRKEHGANLTQEQVVKIMKVQYLNKRSRAYYRHAAMDAQLHGKEVKIKPLGAPESAIQEAIGCSDEMAKKKVATMTFASAKYAFPEGVGKAKVLVMRIGDKSCKASVNYATKDGTAVKGNDYDHMEGTFTFEKDETEKFLEIPIKDDKSFENDEFFTVELSGASCDEASGCKAQLGVLQTVTIVIVDDDLPGDLRFKVEEMEATEGADAATVNVSVERFNGSTGAISCSYSTENMDAVEGVDYEASNGTLEFASSQLTANIQVTVNPRGRINKAAFNVVLSDPVGCVFDAKTDGGDEKCICHVNIKPKGEEKQANMIESMKARVNSANAIMGHKNYAQQFRDALFQVGEEDEEDEEGEAGGAKAGPSKLDYFMHIVSVPWKLLFAFVPPVDYCGGWACFCGALAMIGVVTAIVGDMANLVGCCLDILPETAAITFVALGTSLPDTFASKTAAMMDPYADASIGNVVGSNSINVFMGIGLAWCVAAVYWETGEITPEWNKRAMALTPDERQSILNACAPSNGMCTKPVFIAPGGTIWFNLMVFCVNAFFALQHMYARRKRFGGELGGPKKGFMGQYFSGCFLVGQWFIYVFASILFARMQDAPMTYGKLAAA